MTDTLTDRANREARPVAARVTRLRAEQTEPGAIVGTATPRLSWVVEDAEPGWRFDRYEVTALAESAVVEGAESVLVPWPLAPLRSRGIVDVRVRLATGDDWTAWSDPLRIEAGLLERGDWSASFVSPVGIGGLDDGAPQLYTDFALDELPVRARLYATAHGVYEASLNGARIGDEVLAPGWTAYDKRLRYQRYDVTDRLVRGANTLSALVGNGWYRGQLVWPGNRSSYGDRLALLAQLELEFADGRRQVIATDESWRACRSGILFDDFYDGERRDLRIGGKPRREASVPVEIVDADHGRLVVRRGPAVRVTEHVPAVRILTSPSGKTIVDFGQNLVGWVRLTVRDSRAGDEVVVRHAEVLEHGELALRPLRSARATSTYLLSGAPVEVLHPTFTFNGFRFAEVSGVDGLDVADVTALVLGSHIERTGWLETSDDRLDRLHQNVVWSMRGNFLDLPTDCPQRDERLGWTGDIQVFAPTASFLFDTSGFLAEWLEDLAADQKPDGGVPHVIPDVLRDPDPAGAAWGDAATLVPAVLHQSYADLGMLRRQYPSMRAWVDKITSIAGADHLWATGPQFGDWLDPTAPPEDPAAAKADPAVIATAYYARSASAVADAAEALGDEADARHYGELADRISAAFNAAYVDERGVIDSDCQTVYAIALAWDLLADETARRGAGERLAELVVQARFRVSTGFVGTPVILEALSRAGRSDLSYRMLLETGLPSWLYAVDMGATTVWERWDSMLPDGTVNPGEMTSFNHYAYGAVADWMHRRVGGLAPAAPGWREVVVRPLADGPLTHARATFDSPYGRIESAWRRAGDGSVRLDVVVPYGVTAHVHVPGADAPLSVGAGRHTFTGAFAV